VDTRGWDKGCWQEWRGWGCWREAQQGKRREPQKGRERVGWRKRHWDLGSWRCW